MAAAVGRNQCRSTSTAMERCSSEIVTTSRVLVELPATTPLAPVRGPEMTCTGMPGGSSGSGLSGRREWTMANSDSISPASIAAGPI